MKYVAFQWLYFLAVGLCVYPKALYLFRKFPERGYAMAKPLGWLLSGYLTWLLVMSGLFSYNRVTILLGIVLILLIPPGSLIEIIRKPFSRTWLYRALVLLRQNWSRALMFELLFLGLLSGYALMRAYRPDIFGAEKMMDFAFLKSILRTSEFPPPDPWFAGGFINYYYFGYYLCSVPIKLLGIPAGIGYNLSLASIAALTLIISLAVGLFLTRRWLYALIGSLTLSVLGNYDAFLQVLSGIHVDQIDIWKSSRVIEKTINEFPAFSFLFADLHGHVMSLPFVLLVIGLIATLARPEGVEAVPERQPDHNRTLFCFASITLGLGCLFMTNIWDFPIYAGFLLLVLLLDDRVIRSMAGFGARWPVLQWADGLVLRGLSWALIIVCALGVVLPFLLYYQGQQQGLGIVKERSNLFEYLEHFGFFILVILWVYVRQYGQRVDGLVRWRQNPLSGLIAIAFLIVFLYTTLRSTVLILVFVICSCAFYELLNRSQSDSYFPDLLVLGGMGLLLVCEVVYIKDFYGNMPRMNTFFKFGYQAWLLLSLATGPLLDRLLSDRDRLGSVRAAPGPKAILFVCLIPLSFFTLFGTYSYSNKFRAEPDLDGTLHIERNHPDDAAALAWLEQQPNLLVLVEAPGDSYQYQSVYSTFSGHTSVLGWQQHEALWRDWSWKTIRERAAEIDQIYTNTDPAVRKTLLQKYRVDYIMFGPTERKKYGVSALDGLKRQYHEAFRHGTVSILKVD
ncbi:hypothetical protein JXQ70_06420 [bacterium]|nr:hypothetical protein [bacterium]